jgi:hypothetical protein
MAQRNSGTGLGDILKWGLVLGGGYLAYRALSPAFFSAAAPAAASSAGGGQSLTLADLVAALKGAVGPSSGGGAAAAGGVTAADLVKAIAVAQDATQNLDQWSYAAQHVSQKPLTISSDQMDKIIAAAGGDRTQLITADQFLSAFHSAGLSGLGARTSSAVRVPIVAMPMADGRVRMVALTPSGAVLNRVYVRST